MVVDFIKLLMCGIVVSSGILLLVGCILKKKNKQHQQRIIDIQKQLINLRGDNDIQKKET